MPSIVIPRRQLVQPQGYARVAGGSWMTYLPSADINSLLDGRRLSNSGVALAIGNSGVAADIDAAADYLEYTQTTDVLGSFHLVAVVDLNASSTFSRLIQSGDSAGYEGFSIWFAPSTSSGSVGNPNSVVISRNISPSTLGERWSTAANSLVRPRSGVVLEIIWGATASDTTAPRVWINGAEQTVTKIQSSTSFNADFDPLAGASVRIGNRQGTVDRGLLGKLYLLHVEQQSRIAPYINPWRLFKPSPRRLYFDSAAVGGGPIDIAGGSTGTGAASASLTTAITVTGAASGSASASMALASNAAAIAGASSASASAALGLTTSIAVTGTSTGSSAAALELSGASSAAIAGAASASASSAMALTTNIRVAGGASGSAAASMLLAGSLPIEITGGAVATAQAFAELTTAILIAGATGASAAASLGLETFVPWVDAPPGRVLRVGVVDRLMSVPADRAMAAGHTDRPLVVSAERGAYRIRPERTMRARRAQ